MTDPKMGPCPHALWSPEPPLRLPAGTKGRDAERNRNSEVAQNDNGFTLNTARKDSTLSGLTRLQSHKGDWECRCRSHSRSLRGHDPVGVRIDSWHEKTLTALTRTRLRRGKHKPLRTRAAGPIGESDGAVVCGTVL
jgi:hypothetical protein